MPRRDLQSLTPAQHEERIGAAAAKAAMQREGLSLRRAAAKYHVRPSAILHWFPDSVVRDRSGTYRGLPDREPFNMLAVVVGGTVAVTTHGSEERAILGQHAAAIRAALDPNKDNPGPLLDMAGTTVAGVELETDPDAIYELFLAGELNFLEIYLASPDAG